MDDSIRQFLTDTSQSLLRLLGEQDLRVDVFRSNRSPSMDHIETIERESAAVRVVHVPSGLVVMCNTYNTRIQNQIAALIELANSMNANS